MPVGTHGRWPWASAALVDPAWGAVLARRAALGRDDAWVAALGLPILVTHQTEEWVRPDGFLPFCNERLLESERPTWPLTERDAFHVNVTAGWRTAILAAAPWRRSAAPAVVVLWRRPGTPRCTPGWRCASAATTAAWSPGSR
jgi:hypothetical protein